jgi:hypothetical protein
MAFALFGVVNPVQRIPMHLQVELKVRKALTYILLSGAGKVAV